MKKLATCFSLCLAFGLSAQWTALPLKNLQLHKCWAVSPDTVVITGGNGKIYRSFDGGQTFDSTATIFNFGEWFNDLQFPSPNKGYVCGGTAFGNHLNFLASTSDAGQTWDSLTSNQFTGYNFRQLHFANDSVGFIVGEYDLLLKTTNGGKNLTQISHPLQDQVNAVYMQSEDTVFLSTYELNISGVSYYRIFKSVNQGTSWTKVYQDTTNGNGFGKVKHINNFYFTDAQNGYACGNNGLILSTTDGGNNWVQQQLNNDTTFFTEIFFLRNGIGYVYGQFAYGGAARPLQSTSTNGVNWHASPYAFSNISFANDSVGYALLDGRVYKTTNGGNIGLLEKRVATTISIYPNPTTDFIWIANTSSKNGIIQLYDATGQLVHEENLYQTKQKIRLNHLSKGVYFLKINQAKMEVLVKK